MSWRRFLVLLRNLSPQSMLSHILSRDDTKDEMPEAEDDEQAEQILYKMLGVKEGD